jgi:glucose/arabinose dehydrogenase
MSHRAPGILALVTLSAFACQGAGAAEAPVGPPASAPPGPVAKGIALVPVVRGLRQPVDLDAIPGDARGRLAIVEKAGRVRLVEGGKLAADPLLDLSGQVSGGNEQGLLGLAFHPDFQKNGRLFVNYTDKRGDTRVVEYKATGDKVDPASARELLKVDQPYANHNGGHVVVGPDGWLWVGLGDGGAANDPHDHGQRDDSRLGKMLRIGLDGADAGKVLVWAKGLRNPWRYAFDRTGDLYIADVGQNLWEEIDVVSAADVKKGGLNFGWRPMEGAHCFKGKCQPKKYVGPVVEYPHAGPGSGCSVTGGAVYRGKALPALDGAYFYADYCTGLLRSFRWSAGKVSDHWEWKPLLDPQGTLSQVSAFGTDHAGELYLLTLDGGVLKLAPAPAKP